jgi:hypothetical protein
MFVQRYSPRLLAADRVTRLLLLIATGAIAWSLSLIPTDQDGWSLFVTIPTESRSDLAWFIGGW